MSVFQYLHCLFFSLGCESLYDWPLFSHINGNAKGLVLIMLLKLGFVLAALRRNYAKHDLHCVLKFKTSCISSKAIHPPPPASRQCDYCMEKEEVSYSLVSLGQEH